ncbi:hypothetical protein GJAV_G00259140 [Gymnothorax javanicus]|nr:hypothetical protein GJAV_G00259140 [Gymnothorax javanicus]
MLEKGSPLTGMETQGECRNGSEENGNVSLSKKRAEIRRRKLLMNSEDRMNRIMGFSGSKKHAGREREGNPEQRVQLDSEKSEAWLSSMSSTRISPFCVDSRGVDKEGSPLQESRDANWKRFACYPRPFFFVCNYLSIFAPFLTLQLVYLGTYKYFPKSAPKMKNTVLTAALLLSRIPAELIDRSMDTYSKMGDVFTDLCVYLFTFVVCHEVIVLFGLEGL